MLLHQWAIYKDTGVRDGRMGARQETPLLWGTATKGGPQGAYLGTAQLTLPLLLRNVGFVEFIAVVKNCSGVACGRPL